MIEIERSQCRSDGYSTNIYDMKIPKTSHTHAGLIHEFDGNQRRYSTVYKAEYLAITMLAIRQGESGYWEMFKSLEAFPSAPSVSPWKGALTL